VWLLLGVRKWRREKGRVESLVVGGGGEEGEE
jgi:hypothetical protein